MFLTAGSLSLSEEEPEDELELLVVDALDKSATDDFLRSGIDFLLPADGC